MRSAVLLALLVAACGGPQLKDHSVDLSVHVPATLEAGRVRDGEPRTVQVRIWTDPGVRALPRWREEITEQLDYASQLLTPLIGARLAVASWHEWARAGDPGDALRALVAVDPGDDVTWILGYVAATPVASKAMSELGASQVLGKHVVVRGWADVAEATALARTLPDLKEVERTEVLGAHRRHKQTVALLHHLAVTLGGIAESDPAWILHPTYSRAQTGFADRTRELMTITLDERLAAQPDEAIAIKLLEAIERADWGGWIPAPKDDVTRTLRSVVDAKRAGKTAADIPTAAYDHVTRIKELARRGDPGNALVELGNLLTAYPGNAALHHLKCELMLTHPGVGDPTTTAACTRASELAPGDPTPHLLVGEALARKDDLRGARAEFVRAQDKIANLPAGADEAWRRLVGTYHAMGALTWTEEVIARAGLTGDPIAAEVAQTRARYGVARGTKVVAPAEEAALVTAIKRALELIYASKYGDAEQTLAAADRRWPGAAGVHGARCDLALRRGQVAAARATCGKALAADPDASWALYLSGVIALKQASTTRAGMVQLQRAIKVDPDLGQAWRTLGKALLRAKDRAAFDELSKDYLARFGQPLPR